MDKIELLLAIMMVIGGLYALIIGILHSEIHPTLEMHANIITFKELAYFTSFIIGLVTFVFGAGILTAIAIEEIKHA